MKRHLFFKTVLLLCALVAGSSSACAAEQQTGFALTAKPFAGSTAISVSGTVTGTKGETWTISLTGSDKSKNPSQSCQKNYYWQIGANGNKTTAVISVPALSGYVSKIEVDCCAYQAKGTVSVTVGGNAFGGAAKTMPTWNSDSKVSGENSGGVLTFSGFASGNIEITMSPNSDGRAIYLHSVTVSYASSVNATISTAKYATFSSPYVLDFDGTGIAVYTATDNGSSVTLNEIATGKVPANTPVILHKSDANGTAISVPVIASAAAISGTNNLAISTGTDVSNMYVLADGSAGVGFYPWAGTTDLSAGKVFLQAKASYGARTFIGFEEETTSINVVKSQNADGQYYNIAGQRVAQPTKGLYIVNGKKVIIK